VAKKPTGAGSVVRWVVREIARAEKEKARRRSIWDEDLTIDVAAALQALDRPEAIIEARINSRKAAAAAKERTSVTARQVEAFRTICAKKGYPLDTVDRIKELAEDNPKKRGLAKEMGRSVKTIGRYIEAVKRNLDMS
jgi:hypothetical protein